MRDLKSRVKEIEAKRLQFTHLRSIGKYKESLVLEKEYLVERQEIIAETESEISKKRSIPLSTLKEEVERRPKPILYATGIGVLDDELVYDFEYGRETGGFGLGNYIQIGGVKGSGKTSLVVKLLGGLSRHSKVSWLNFEMSDMKVIRVLSKIAHNDTNMYYYDGERELEAIKDEIKYLYQNGVKHFLVDSMMKVNVKGKKRGYESVGEVSSAMSELSARLNINIYMINQVSQETEKGGGYYAKHGNDSEYDADYIFFIMKKPLMKDGVAVKDKAGIPIMDEESRILTCTKNRDTDRLFSIELHKRHIFGVEYEVVDYAEE